MDRLIRWLLIVLLVLTTIWGYVATAKIQELEAKLDLRYFNTFEDLKSFVDSDNTNEESGMCVDLAMKLISNAAQQGYIIHTQIEKDGENSHMWCYTIVLSENRGYFIEPSCDLIYGGDYLIRNTQ